MKSLSKWLVYIVVLCAVCFFAGRAAGANISTPELNAIATTISQKAVSVYCEDDPWEWAYWEQHFMTPTRLAGFTYPDYFSGRNLGPFSLRTLYINPRECLSLRALLNHEDVGVFYASEAMLVLTHEAMHQRLNSGDEAVVECNALKSLRDVAVTLFHVPETAEFPYIARVTKVVKRKGKRVKVSTLVVKTKLVPNAYLDGLLTVGQRWHDSLPANYKGVTC